MFRKGDHVDRIGSEAVDGIVLQIKVDMGSEPGTVLRVKVGDEARDVVAEACQFDKEIQLREIKDDARELMAEVLRRLPPGMPDSAFQVPIDQIRHDGATMPCADGADGADVTPSMG